MIFYTKAFFFLVSQILNNVWEKALKFVLIRALQTLAQDFFSSVAYFVIKSFLNFSSVLKRLNHSTSMSLPLLPQLWTRQSVSQAVNMHWVVKHMNGDAYSHDPVR